MTPQPDLSLCSRSRSRTAGTEASARARPSAGGRASTWVARLGARAAPLRCVIVLLILVSGCANTTANLAGWYVTRQIDGYFDLSSEQKARVRQRVDRLIVEIRGDELPKLLYLMRLVRDAIRDDQVPSRILQLQDRSDAFLERAAARVIPELAWLLAQLTDGQIGHFERRLTARVEELYEEQRLPPAERREQRDEQLVEGMEKAVGELTAEQQAALLAVAHGLPDDRPARYRRDLERIGSTTALLRTHPGQAAIEAELRRLWDTRYEVEAGRDKLSRMAEQRSFLLALDRLVNADQRKHAVNRLEDQIRSLARFELRGGAPPGPRAQE
jgi:hypothetical protein